MVVGMGFGKTPQTPHLHARGLCSSGRVLFWHQPGHKRLVHLARALRVAARVLQVGGSEVQQQAAAQRLNRHNASKLPLSETHGSSVVTAVDVQPAGAKGVKSSRVIIGMRTLHARESTAAAAAGPLPPSVACQRAYSYQTCKGTITFQDGVTSCMSAQYCCMILTL